jgi:hypothetical protein
MKYRKAESVVTKTEDQIEAGIALQERVAARCTREEFGLTYDSTDDGLNLDAALSP